MTDPVDCFWHLSGARHYCLCLFFFPAGRLVKVHRSDCMYAPASLVSVRRRWPA